MPVEASRSYLLADGGVWAISLSGRFPYLAPPLPPYPHPHLGILGFSLSVFDSFSSDCLCVAIVLAVFSD